MQYLENNKLDHLIGLAMWDCGAKDAEFFRNIDTSYIPENPRLDRNIHRLIKKKAREATVKKTKRIACVLLLQQCLSFRSCSLH